MYLVSSWLDNYFLIKIPDHIPLSMVLTNILYPISGTSSLVFLNPLPTWEAKIRLSNSCLYISRAHSLFRRPSRIRFIQFALSACYRPDRCCSGCWGEISRASYSHILPNRPTGDWTISQWSQDSVRRSDIEVCACKFLSRVWLFTTPRTVARQAPLFMEFSRWEYWSALPFQGSLNVNGWKWSGKVSPEKTVFAWAGFPQSRVWEGKPCTSDLLRDIWRSLSRNEGSEIEQETKWGLCWSLALIPGDFPWGVEIIPELSLFEPKRTDFWTLTSQSLARSCIPGVECLASHIFLGEKPLLAESESWGRIWLWAVRS